MSSFAFVKAFDLIVESFIRSFDSASLEALRCCHEHFFGSFASLHFWAPTSRPTEKFVQLVYSNKAYTAGVINKWIIGAIVNDVAVKNSENDAEGRRVDYLAT